MSQIFSFIKVTVSLDCSREASIGVGFAGWFNGLPLKKKRSLIIIYLHFALLSFYMCLSAWELLLLSETVSCCLTWSVFYFFYLEIEHMEDFGRSIVATLL